jgi:hypothetical protein
VPALRVIAILSLLPQAAAFYGRIDNPPPVLSSISPSRVAAGSPNQVLTLTGHNFVTSSSILFNGAQRSTSYVNSSRLTMPLTASDLLAPGTFTVTVATPGPGGGTSAPAHLVVQARTE